MDFYWKSLRPLMRDDLFVRVIAFLFGLALGGLGACVLLWASKYDSSGDPMWLELLLWGVGLAIALWGGLLLARSAAPSGSRIWRLGERVLPDSADDGGWLMLAFCVPAALITMLLRAAGVRGSSADPGHDA
jgi:hypothetical protein